MANYTGMKKIYTHPFLVVWGNGAGGSWALLNCVCAEARAEGFRAGLKAWKDFDDAQNNIGR